MKPQNEQIRKRVAFDGGNRFIKWIDPNGIARCIPSFIKPLESWEDAQSDDRSVVVEVGGDRYAIGQVAQDLGGSPTFQGDKCDLAWLLALAAIEPNPGQSQVLIEMLAIALPDSRNTQAVENIKRVEGTKEFIRNGQRIVSTVRKVEPVDETRPAYRYAMHKGLFKYARNNGILDLGGGTGIGRLYTPNGTAIRAGDVIVPGTFALAGKIAAALTPQLGYSPSLSLIMDGIATGDYLYGTTGVNFKPIFLKCRDSWITDIRADLKTAWIEHLNSLGEVLIVGGSASLAEPLVEATQGRFKIAPQPQFISIFGMALE